MEMWLGMYLAAVAMAAAPMRQIGDTVLLEFSNGGTAAGLLGNGDIVVGGVLPYNRAPSQNACWVNVVSNNGSVIAQHDIVMNNKYLYALELAVVDGGGFVFGCQITALNSNIGKETISDTLELSLYSNTGELVRSGINTTVLLPYSETEWSVFETVTVAGGFAVIANNNNTFYTFTRYSGNGDVVGSKVLEFNVSDFGLGSGNCYALPNGGVVVAGVTYISPVSYPYIQHLIVLDANGSVTSKSSFLLNRTTGDTACLYPSTDGFYLSYESIVLVFDCKAQLTANITTDIDDIFVVAPGKDPSSETLVAGLDFSAPFPYSNVVTYKANGTHTNIFTFDTQSYGWDWLLRPPGTDILWNVFGYDWANMQMAVKKYELLE